MNQLWAMRETLYRQKVVDGSVILSDVVCVFYIRTQSSMVLENPNPVSPKLALTL